MSPPLSPKGLFANFSLKSMAFTRYTMLPTIPLTLKIHLFPTLPISRESRKGGTPALFSNADSNPDFLIIPPHLIFYEVPNITYAYSNPSVILIFSQSPVITP